MGVWSIESDAQGFARDRNDSASYLENRPVSRQRNVNSLSRAEGGSLPNRGRSLRAGAPRRSWDFEYVDQIQVWKEAEK